jgi:uncharacterized protein (TIGR02117 family)
MKLKNPLLLIIICLIFAGCLNPVRDLYPDNPDLRNVPVYVVSHGWHAGFAIESEFVLDQIPEHSELPDTKFLKFGWGDARYYSNPDAGFWIMMRAALLPTKSAIHVVGFDIPVELYFSGSKVVEIKITEEGAAELGKFIDQTIKKDNARNPIYYADGLYRNSVFLEAEKSYIFPRTSNKWTAKAIRKTGYPISPFYAFTSGNVIKQASEDGILIQ